MIIENYESQEKINHDFANHSPYNSLVACLFRHLFQLYVIKVDNLILLSLNYLGKL